MWRSDAASREEIMPEFSIFDGHNDTLLRFYQDDVTYKDFFRELDSGHIDLVRARRGGFAGGFFAVWTPNEQRIAPDSMPDTSKPFTPPAVDYEFARGVALRMSADLFRIEAESAGKGQGRAHSR